MMTKKSALMKLAKSQDFTSIYKLLWSNTFTEGGVDCICTTCEHTAVAEPDVKNERCPHCGEHTMNSCFTLAYTK
jgi:predicted RNA-binding Zn-ribbon protein involved in translation (DUF1610 family)